jgi:hypothetical protein
MSADKTIQLSINTIRSLDHVAAVAKEVLALGQGRAR